MAELLVGLVAGFFVGQLMVGVLHEGENGTDLLPALADWPAIWFVLVVTWLTAFLLALTSRRWWAVALGWCLGLPVTFAITLFYAWHTFGTFGYAPLP